MRAEEWSSNRTTGTVTYTIPLEEGQETVHVDLLCPDEGTLPRLYIVDKVRLGGLVNPGDEAVDLVLEEMALEDDPGVDHTGRDEDPRPRTVGSFKTTWDFLSDWQGMSLARDGNTRVLEWPGDPWANGGPEKGRGYIEPLQHCPTSSNTGLLHYARPIGDLAAVGLVEGMAASIDATAMTDALGPGDVVESLGSGLMYWGANQPWHEPTQEQEPGLPLPASVHVISQTLARGIEYTLQVRKALGGAAWGLVRSPDGRQRIIRNSVAAKTSEWVIWQRVTAYLDGNGSPISAPSGCPALNAWELVDSGGLWERLDQHGLFITPGLKPSRTRIWNSARGTDPADHTDTADVDHAGETAATVADHFGAPVEILICNTGGPPANPDALAFTREQWEAAHRSLVLGPMALIEAVMPAMRRRGFGRIVNVVSTAAREPIGPLMLSNTHRAGMLAAFTTIAHQVARDGVTLNSLLTGRIATERLFSLNCSQEAAERRAAEEVPAGRLGTPEEMAAAAAFLCSIRAAYITGTSIAVDGGLSRAV